MLASRSFSEERRKTPAINEEQATKLYRIKHTYIPHGFQHEPLEDKVVRELHEAELVQFNEHRSPACGLVTICYNLELSRTGEEALAEFLKEHPDVSIKLKRSIGPHSQKTLDGGRLRIDLGVAPERWESY